ncbi:hypothetical protein BDZ94DRAFT_1253419 [Collybia nuda]|uniref:Uncharacterized protein n=1 Tax=Collybia nuda TaxID=64659 RepID=A0A9P5YD94_9AGAR|nr:hypothetical protein BDZ94DRAFT_1253419 [Collybia nuda]
MVPQLWCSLSVSPDMPGPFDSEILLKSTILVNKSINTGNVWFRRAGSAGMLSLSLRSGYMEEQALCHLVDELIIPRVDQFRDLELVSSRLTPFSLLLSLPPGSAQSLKSLVLGVEGGVSVTIFESAPRLQRACVSGIYGNDRLLPWSQLTHLKIAQYLSAPRWISLITQCVNLQEGDFAVRGVDASTLPGNRDDITIPDLRSLAVKFIGGDSSLFNQFYFPSLRKFRLDAELILGRDGWLEPTRFYGQLSSLRSLSLINKAINAQNLIQLLRCTTSLVELELDNNLDYGSLLRSLIYIDQSANLIPRLEAITLYLGVGTLSAFPSHVFVNMVHSRQWAYMNPPKSASRLRRVSLFTLNEWRVVLNEVNAWLEPHRLYNGQLVTELKVVPLLPQADDRVEMAHW